MVEFPVTVFSNIIRIPVSLSYVRLLGEPYLRLLRSGGLSDLVIFDFHLHDLYTLDSSSAIPFERFPLFYRTVFRRIYTGRNGNGMGLLENLINLFSSKGFRFLKLVDVYETVTQKR